MADVKGKGGWVFYYDGDCGFCTLSVRFFALLDFFSKVTWTDFRALPEPPLDLTWEDLDAAAYLEIGSKSTIVIKGSNSNGRSKTYRGFYAVRMLTLRLPPLFPLVAVLWLPGVNRIGEAAYAWVAANRYRISRRCRLKAER